MADDQVAAGCYSCGQPADDARGLAGADDVVQHVGRQDCHRLDQIQAGRRARNRVAWVAEVGAYVTAPPGRAAGEQRPRERHHERVGVGVDDGGVRVDALGDVVDVVDGWQAAADVEELGDPLLATRYRTTLARKYRLACTDSVSPGKAESRKRRPLPRVSGIPGLGRGHRIWRPVMVEAALLLQALAGECHDPRRQ